MKCLLTNGAEVDAKDYNEQTPLWLASTCELLYQDHILEIVQCLIDHGAEVNIENNDGDTPLHCVKETIVAQCLIDHGANIEA